MREKNRVNRSDLFPQALHSKIRPGIHHDPAFTNPDENRRPRARIPRVTRSANRAVAIDHRHAMRRARAQERDFKFGRSFHFKSEPVIFPAHPAMLASLRIRNFALVDSLNWEIPAGFVAITGETGAGKSILIGGLELLLGERADKSAIRAGATECTVEAILHVTPDSGIHAVLADHGLDPCEDGQLLLKRIIPASGTGRQFANGSPCTLAVLRKLGECLVDLHGPHDHQSLFSTTAQTRLLDAFASAQTEIANYRAARATWLALVAERDDGEADEQAIAREVDLLEHQVAEIESADFQPDEESDLLAKHHATQHAQRLAELAAAASEAIDGEATGVTDRWTDVVRAVKEMARLDPTAEPLAETVDSLAESINALAQDLQSHASRIDTDPATRNALETRVDLLESLKRKYGATIPDILEFADRSRTRLETLHNREARRASLDGEIATAKAGVNTAAKALTAKRQKAAPLLAKTARAHLADLGFLKADFTIALTACEPAPEGAESVEFVFAPNPGEPPQPLRAIASSGEISRVMLALKTSLAAQDEVPVLVFDEIDANVGGEIAHAVGAKMREIGSQRQVLCITHLPQVASAAPHHFVVSKAIADGRTRTQLAAVDADTRQAEIARMLGNRDGTAALAHAKELLSTPDPKPSASR